MHDKNKTKAKTKGDLARYANKNKPLNGPSKRKGQKKPTTTLRT
jgi:hypothetical protein